MNEDPPPSAPAPAPKPTTNGNQKLIIGLVLGAVVLLLFLLVLQMTGGGFGGGQSELEKLKAERDAKQKALNSNSIPTLISSSGQSPQALANRLSADSSTLAGLVSQLHALLSKSQNDLKISNGTIQTLSVQLATSSSSVTENTQLKTQLATAQSRATNAESQLASLQQQLAKSPSSAQMESALRERDEAVKTRESHRQQFAQLNEQIKNMEASEIAITLREQLATMTEKAAILETENNKLYYLAQELRANLDHARLFVEAEALPAKAKILYDELAKLNSATPAELQTEYERINQDLGARVVETVTFQTSSSNIARDKVEQIRLKLAAGGDESFYLVVGYASKSGALEGNRPLSAERATRIASVTNHQKKKDQGVQAIFLSETSRFGEKLTDNQICEIWEVRK